MSDWVSGLFAKAYVEGASAGFDNLVEMTLVRDASVDIESSTTDITIRGNGGWGAEGVVLNKATAEMEVLFKPSDTTYQTLKTAALQRLPVEAAFLTGAKGTEAVAGSEGPYGKWVITKMSRPEPLEDAIKISFSLSLNEFIGWTDDGTDPSA